MRVISKQEHECTCTRCRSVIGIMSHEFSVMGPPGPYDMDYDPSEVGQTYWICPVCKTTNWMGCLNKFPDDMSY